MSDFPLRVGAGLTLLAAVSAAHAGGGATVLRVDASAAAGGNGQSWKTPYRDLQSALDAAALAGPGTQVWVAAGVYVPSARTDEKKPRSATFALPNRVEVYGGFAGHEQSLEERDPAKNITTLSGDLGGDDQPNFFNRADNAFHVVTAAEPGARLDGFTIRGGAADGDDHTAGGGVLVALDFVFPEPPFELVHCVLTDNQASSGGGLRGTHFEVFNCWFIGNQATNGGGAGTDGPIGSDTRRFVNCAFINNTAVYGGGLEGIYGGFSLINCTVVGNAATAEDFGVGGVLIQGPGSSAEIINTIIWGNTARAAQTPEQAQFWTPNSAFEFVFSHSCIQDWSGTHAATEMTSDDPLFADPLGPDGVMWSGDEIVNLSADSPCVDAGDDEAIGSDVVDVDGDGDADEPLPIDLLGAARTAGDAVDIGAVEHQPGLCTADFVSGATFQPPGDGAVDAADLAFLLGAWGPNVGSPADMVSSATFQPPGDGVVDGADLAVLLGSWGDCP